MLATAMAGSVIGIYRDLIAVTFEDRCGFRLSQCPFVDTRVGASLTSQRAAHKFEAWTTHLDSLLS